jgi:hypothetical protein
MNTEYEAQHHAVLFGTIAKPVVESYPDAAEKILRNAVILYGNQRGQRMRQRAIADGLPICTGVYQLYREYVIKAGEFRSEKTWNDDGDLLDRAWKCPWSTAWREHDLSRYAGVYCRHIDAALGRGFGDNIIIEGVHNMTDGAEQCEIWFRGEKSQDALFQNKLDELKKGEPQRKQKPWEYHLAHIYSACRAILTESLGSLEAENVLQKAVLHFESLFGKGSSEQFLKLTSLDFLDTSDYEGSNP